MTSLQIILGILFIAAFIFLTVKRKSLTLGGAITAAGMGIWVVYFAGMLWLIPLFFFFISGTLLGKLNSKTEIVSDEKHGKGRDVWQVICNGFPYVFLATFAKTHQEESFWLMSASIAIAVCDTWSSEIGMYFRGNTFDIMNWKKQPPGISGGISKAGTLGGFLGAFLSAGLCGNIIYEHELSFVFHSFALVPLVTLNGLLGMLLDSVLGSAFQLKFTNPNTGELSDTATAENTIQSGIPWMSNDVVNLVSNLVGTGIIGLIFLT